MDTENKSTKSKNIVRKDIWQEDLERELVEHLENGFDLRGVKTLRKCSRREGEPQQYFYRVIFEMTPEVAEDSVQGQSEERESVGAK